MFRRLFTVLPACGTLLLAGCAQPAAPAPPSVPVEARAYVCRLSDAPAASGAEQHVTVSPDDQRKSLLLRVNGQTGWRALALLAGSGAPVYADTTYAWRATGTAGVLTDIRNVQTYNCVIEGAAK
jgi:hypothetical protein